MCNEITSPQNPHVKRAARLRTRRGREQQGRIIIDGTSEVLRAIQANVEVESIFFCEDWGHSQEQKELLAALRAHDTTQYRTSGRVYEKIAFGNRTDVVAVAKPPLRQLHDIEMGACPLVGILEGVEKPGNVGAILRSADGAGLDAVIVVDGGTDLFNPNTIRASLGIVFSLTVVNAAFDALSDWVAQHELQALLARVDGAIGYVAADYRVPTAIVLGSETEGLSSRWSQMKHQAVKLPMFGVADSLNVSAAAAILFYEARRQRAEN